MMNNWKGVGSFGTVGLEIVVAIVLGLLGGRWMDGKFHTAPYLTVVGFFFGLVTAGKAVFRTWKEMQRETEREEREQGNPAPIYDPELDKDLLAKENRRSPLPPPFEETPSKSSDEQQQP